MTVCIVDDNFDCMIVCDNCVFDDFMNRMCVKDLLVCSTGNYYSLPQPQ